MKKEEAIELFNRGEKIRLTSGIWNYPKKDGKFAKSVEEIKDFYEWAYKVDKKGIESGIIDLIGETRKTVR